MNGFHFLVLLIVPILAFIITWKNSAFFISKSERFFKSKFEILFLKLSLSGSVWLLTFVLTFILFYYLSTNESKVITPISNSTYDLDNNSEQINSNKTENNPQNFIVEENEESLQDTLKKDIEINDSVTKSYTQNQEDLDKATQMLKRDKSVREIADSTSLTKKEIRQLRRKLKK